MRPLSLAMGDRPLDSGGASSKRTAMAGGFDAHPVPIEEEGTLPVCPGTTSIPKVVTLHGRAPGSHWKAGRCVIGAPAAAAAAAAFDPVASKQPRC